MIERALQYASKRTQGAEIRRSQERSSTASYEDDKLKKVWAAQSTHVSARVIVEGKLGRAFGTDPEQVEAVVDRAIELAEFGSEAPFAFPGPAPGAEVKTYDPAVEQTTREELVAEGSEIVDRVKAYNPEIKMNAETGWTVGSSRLMNSSGLEVTHRGSSYFGYGYGDLVRGTDMVFSLRYRQWRKRDVDTAQLADGIIGDYRRAERNATVESKPMPVIFTPRAARVLLMPLLMGVNGKNVLKGDSPLAGKLGQKLVDARVSLTDDGTVDFAPDSSPYDGEGVPRRRTQLIADGVLTSFLYDLETAAKAGRQSTGNGPGCGSSNVLLAPGDTSFEDLVKGTQEGVIIESVMGLGQGNIINGDFSVNIALGYKIERGEVVGRVKNAMLAGNAYEALNKLEAIGSEAEWVGSTYAPAIKIAGLSVVAKE
jgi:PmbA protein